MSQSILAIDLGTFSVKILLLERRLTELHLVSFFDLPLSHHARQAHHEQVTEALKVFFAEHQLHADIVTMNLPGHLLSMRIIDVPSTSLKRMRQMAEFELEGHIPFPIEEVFLDYHVLSQEKESSRLLCSYTYEEHIQKYFDCMTGLDLDAKYWGADLTDFAAIAQVAVVAGEGYYLLLDIGHSKTNFLLMEGRELKYARTIGVGGYHFTRALQRAFNLNFEKAEALKLSRGKLYIREQESDQISRILSKVAGELIAGIKQTIMAASKYFDFNAILAAYCCGGGTRLVGILDHLSFHLRMNFFELDTLTFTSHQFEDPDEINRMIPQVLATAIRPIYFNKVPRINFRQGPFAYKRDVQALTKEFKFLGVLLAVIFVMGTLYYFLADHHYAARIASLNQRVEKIIGQQYKDMAAVAKPGKGKKKETGVLKKYLATVDSELKNLEEQLPSAGGAKNLLQVMETISKALPPKKDVNFEAKEFGYFADAYVQLKATTNDPLNVDKIVEGLRRAGVFSEITPTDAKRIPGDLWEFSLKLEFKKPNEG